ncbi:diaminopimelate decarboxylase [Carnobacterium gallinarum]|uniref:diaminopimelate decarboxylase n=1 Tax=Carnobacterium gallinarum TaxID=2749 RepID=UPI000553EFDA|nr:diaminopimelate decarboxylase [Carnobacterium gallinarum]
MNNTLLTGTMKVNEQNHLEIGGVDTVTLVEKHGTPVYVYDVFQIKEKARAFKNTFAVRGIKAQVAYASKAFACTAIYQLMAQEGLSVDVVSGGELYTAIHAGYPKEKIHFHGNNKTESEIVDALNYEIGCFVVDNFNELDLLQHHAAERNQKVAILLRVTPGVEAHTHEYISTGQEDSKFGFDLLNGQAEKAVEVALASSHLDLLGLHSHIGSQIFETQGFLMAIDKLLTEVTKWQKTQSFDLKVLNLGGGFGIRYVEGDQPLPVSEYVNTIIDEVITQTTKFNLAMPEIWIEPGRSIVGDAGITLYQTGSEKQVPDVRNYLAIDGGMTDNIRPALYEAEYTGVLANRANDIATETYSIAGKCCESGDMLIWDLPLPKREQNDILAVFSTGAYGYSMANNYNRIPRPPVVFVENGIDYVVVERESYADLISLDRSLPQG